MFEKRLCVDMGKEDKGMEMGMRIGILISLFTGFFMLFYKMRVMGHVMEFLRRTRWDMDMASRQRNLAGRRRLLELQREHSPLMALEQRLQYSGLKLRYPGLKAEWWIAGNVVTAVAVFLVGLLFGGIGAAFVSGILAVVAGYLWLRLLCIANLRRVNGSLMKLLDFLGNYSITAAEVTGVFEQVARYMEEPIKSALDTCSYEAQTTGDAGLALLSMAERIEHPKFKELARNMEISLRYCADFSALVTSSKRSLREYLRVTQERKGMLREALVNMALLLGMSVAVLFTVGHLIDISVWWLLTDTVPGRMGLCALAVIFGLFAGQMQKVQG